MNRSFIGSPKFFKTLEGDCCGCTACMSLCPTGAISMKENSKGFYAPRPDHTKCIDCGRCLTGCVFHSPKEIDHKKQEFYAVQYRDDRTRMESQSGGAYTAFAESFLEKAGILYGVEYSGTRAVYSRIMGRDQLYRLKGSKYVQADMGDSFQKIGYDLAAGKSVLFAGTPCYVDGLKRYIQTAQVPENNLYTIDLICHGVPSPRLFAEYLELLSQQHGSQITKFNFRDKQFGWGEHICSYYANEEQHFTRNFVNIFYSNLCLNEVCFACPYSSMDRVGDITIGDYWGIENVFPEMADHFGTSLVIVNTDRGGELFRQSKSRLCFEESSAARCIQPSLKRPIEKPGEYAAFWELYAKEGILLAVSKYCGYRKFEENFADLSGRKYFENILNILQEKDVKEILLYGIGLTMWQMLRFIENSDTDIKVRGILDRQSAETGRTFFGYAILNEQEIKGKTGTIVICTKNSESAAIIKKRLASSVAYRQMHIMKMTGSR